MAAAASLTDCFQESEGGEATEEEVDEEQDEEAEEVGEVEIGF